MHFPTLVILKDVPLDLTEYAQNSDEPIDPVLEDDNGNWLYIEKMSPFAHAVEHILCDAIKPYYDHNLDPQYRTFHDATDTLRKAYETEQMRVFVKNGKYYAREDMPNFYVCRDGVVREELDGQLFLSAEAQKITAEMVPVKDFYKSFNKFARTRCKDYDAETKRWGEYYNPNAFLEEYFIGNRYRQILLVKDNVKDVHEGWHYETPDPDARKAPAGYKWVAAARLKNIEWEVMFAEQRKAHKRWLSSCRKLWSLRETAKDESLPRGMSFDDDGIYMFAEQIFDSRKTIDEQMKSKYPFDICTFSWHFTDILDTSLQPQQAHLNKEANEGYTRLEWAEEVDFLLHRLNEDDVLVFADCIG